MTSKDEGSEEGVEMESMLDIVRSPMLVEDVVTLTLDPAGAEKLRSFLQAHNVGHTDLSPLYQNLLAATDAIGVTKKPEFQFRLQPLGVTDGVMKSEFADHRARDREVL